MKFKIKQIKKMKSKMLEKTFKKFDINGPP